MDITKVSVIVPTYNERENISELVKRIDFTLNKKFDYEIIIVDDNSPDETWRIAQKLSENFPIKVVRRFSERGLATAVLRGVKEASGDIVVVMDADMQHPPEVIPRLVEPIIRGEANIVIGSRYVEGGGVENWSAFRKLVSWGARFLSHMALPNLRTIRDTLSGFFAFRKDIIKDVELNPIGYKILLEILVKTGEDKVLEVPYIFRSRERGKSKLGWTQIFNYIKHLLNLSIWTGDLWRLFKYVLVGISGIAVNLLLLYFLVETGMSKSLLTSIGFNATENITKLVAAAISVEISIIWNYLLNNFWTYKSRRQRGKGIIKGAAKFNLVSLIGYVINLTTFWLLITTFKTYYITAELIAIFVAFVWNFTINDIWTWKIKKSK